MVAVSWRERRQGFWEYREGRDAALRSGKEIARRMRERLAKKELGVTMFMIDDDRLLANFLISLGLLYEPLRDVEGLTVHNSILIPEDVMKWLSEQMLLKKAEAGLYKVIGIARHLFSLLSMPSIFMPGGFLDEILHKEPDTTQLTDKINDMYRKHHSAAMHVRKVVLLPRSRYLFTLLLLPLMNIFPPSKDERVEICIPLSEVNWGNPNGTDFVLSLYAASLLKEFSRFDLSIIGSAHAQKNPVDNYFFVIVDYILASLLETGGIVPRSEPRGLSPSQLGASIRKHMEERSFFGADIALLGACYIDQRRLKEEAEACARTSIGNALDGSGLGEDDAIGIEQIWILPSRKQEEDYKTIGVNTIPDHLRKSEPPRYSVRVLPMPWMHPCIISKVWVSPRDLSCKLRGKARSWTPKLVKDSLESFSKEQEGDVKEHFEHVLMAWDQMVEELAGE